MPIKPENRHRYPTNWQQIREAILERAKNKCEWCGVPNHSDVRTIPGTDEREQCLPDEEGAVYVVCTVAHLDHRPENNDPQNLRFLCQRCHNRHDAPHRRANARRTRRQRARQLEMGV